MEIGKLYIDKRKKYIVECTHIQDGDRFNGKIIDKGNSTFWQTGDTGVGFDTNCFIECKITKPNNNILSQIGGDHYTKNKIQPIEYILANGLDFCSGNIVKYITRYKDKNGLEDLEKAKHYIELLIKNYEISKIVE